ncbi:hypothetical protein BDY21DRAFT_350006 [Lineolata rhizophorae]|uniref:Uncharacterized protein n=1 Tax=Lineolata rhizophorae TaxID=578093 RepID=A0A6A6NVS8_9PEZI|nr:hypothetical protein BDY21DRAFT_350006 [Lineolata rhizophorae]
MQQPASQPASWRQASPGARTPRHDAVGKRGRRLRVAPRLTYIVLFARPRVHSPDSGVKRT